MKVLIYIFFCIMTLATLGSCGSRKDKTAHVNRMVYHAVADTLPLSYNDIVTTGDSAGEQYIDINELYWAQNRDNDLRAKACMDGDTAGFILLTMNGPIGNLFALALCMATKYHYPQAYQTACEELENTFGGAFDEDTKRLYDHLKEKSPKPGDWRHDKQILKLKDEKK